MEVSVSASDWFDLGCELQRAERHKEALSVEQAIDAYRLFRQKRMHQWAEVFEEIRITVTKQRKG